MARHLKRRGPGRRALLAAHAQRRADARALFRASRWAGAVYMAGYVIECLLKAAILSRRGIKNLPEDFWHHDLHGLAAKAGVIPALEDPRARSAGEALRLIIRVWDVTMRYEGCGVDPERGRRFMSSVEEFRTWLLSRI